MDNYYPRTPRSFAPSVFEHLMNGQPLTRADITRIGLSHGLGYYRAHEVVESMTEQGVLKRQVGGYKLTPRYQSRVKRTQ